MKIPNPAYEKAPWALGWITAPGVKKPPELRFTAEDYPKAMQLLREGKGDEFLKLAIPETIESP